jgi:transposase-like protein
VPGAGPKKIHRYSLEFKLKAVKLSQLKGVEVQAVAGALEIHPFMLSRWRKEARDGVLRGRVSGPKRRRRRRRATSSGCNRCSALTRRTGAVRCDAALPAVGRHAGMVASGESKRYRA